MLQLLSRVVSLLSDEEKAKVLAPSGSVPVSVFRCGLSGLEAVTVYLRDELKWGVSRISAELCRKPGTIYATYANAKSKLRKRLDVSDFSASIPLSVIADRRFSVLESVVAHLRGSGNGLPRIAALLGKSYSTVRTVHRRYQEKCR